MLAFAQHPHFAMRACGLFRRLDPACIRAAAALLLAILRDEVCAQPLLASLGTAEAERELSHAFDELLANAQEHGSAKRASGSGNESEEEEEEEEEEEGGGGDRGDREWAQALLLAVRFVREATAHCFRGPDVLQPMNIGTVVTWASQSDVVYDLASIALGRFLVLGSDSEVRAWQAKLQLVRPLWLLPSPFFPHPALVPPLLLLQLLLCVCDCWCSSRCGCGA